LAQSRLSLLLALEVAPTGRATADRNGAARVENPLWGAPRIHGELLKLGFEVAQSSVAKYMVKRPARCVDHVIVFGDAHLRQILRSYPRYYNDIRSHRSLDKDAPVSRPVQWIASIKSHVILGGLHHHYVRV
jgi:hypothetical protein